MDCDLQAIQCGLPLFLCFLLRPVSYSTPSKRTELTRREGEQRRSRGRLRRSASSLCGFGIVLPSSSLTKIEIGGIGRTRPLPCIECTRPSRDKGVGST